MPRPGFSGPSASSRSTRSPKGDGGSDPPCSEFLWGPPGFVVLTRHETWTARTRGWSSSWRRTCSCRDASRTRRRPAPLVRCQSGGQQGPACRPSTTLFVWEGSGAPRVRHTFPAQAPPERFSSSNDEDPTPRAILGLAAYLSRAQEKRIWSQESLIYGKPSKQRTARETS